MREEKPEQRITVCDLTGPLYAPYRRLMEAVWITRQNHAQDPSEATWAAYRDAVREVGEWCAEHGAELVKHFERTCEENRTMRIDLHQPECGYVVPQWARPENGRF